MKFRLLASALLSLGLIGALQEPAKKKVEPITVIVLRHAETTESTAKVRDPELSEAGERRAAELATLFGEAEVSHIFSSEYKRTRATVLPLAEQLELEVNVISAAKEKEQLAALKKLKPGNVAVICGHSNTVPGIVAKLGGQVKGLVDHPKYGKMLKGTEFGRIFVVTIPGVRGTKVKTLELRY